MPSQPAPTAPQPQTSGAAAKDPASVPANSKAPPQAPVKPAPILKAAPQPPPAALPKAPAVATKESSKQPTAPSASGASPQQAASEIQVPQQKPTGAEAVKITGPKPPPGASAGGVGKDRAKQAYFTGGAGARGGGDHQKLPQGNAWLISKALPVDVRLLAAGAASIGALYFYNSRQQQPGQDPPPSHGGDGGGGASAEISGSGESSGAAEEGSGAGEEVAGTPEMTDGLADDVHESSDAGEGLLSASDEPHKQHFDAGRLRQAFMPCNILDNLPDVHFFRDHTF